jgi:archaeal cell division control protein 6
MFEDMLKDSESLFKNDVALDFSFQPKLLKYREKEQKYIASCIRPLFNNMNGRNIFVYGRPGIGKTIAVQKLLEEIEEQYDEVIPIYINCWQKNTSYKVAIDICEAVGYKFTQNKKTEELFKILENIINRRCAVFVFDEIDKAEEIDFIYTLLEKIYRKSIVMITNSKDWLLELEDRIKSRLASDTMEFKPYNAEETRGILEQRKELAFVPGVWEKDAFDRAVAKTIELQDIRSGLHILKEAGLTAEHGSSRKITAEHVETAVKKLDTMAIKSSADLEDDTKQMLDIVKDGSGKKIGDLFRDYQAKGGESSYKTFQRKIAKLEENGFVSLKKISGGPEGSTTIVNYLKTAKLTDF